MTWRKYAGISLLIYALALFSGSIFYLISDMLGMVQTANQLIMVTTMGYIIGAILMIVLYLDSQKCLKWEQQTFSRKKIIIWGIVGIFLALILQNIASVIEMLLLGETMTSENTDAIIEMIRANRLFVLATAIGGPIMEEFIFRRVILGSVSRLSNFFVGALVSSLLFALAHGDGHLLVYGFLGIFLAFLYEYSGSIWTSIITHAGMNTLVIVSYLLLT